MLHWINDHGVECMIFYFVFSCAVSPMPAPSADGSVLYKWLYGFLHAILQAIAGNWMRIPGLANAFNLNGPPGSGAPPDQSKAP